MINGAGSAFSLLCLLLIGLSQAFLCFGYLNFEKKDYIFVVFVIDRAILGSLLCKVK